MPAASGERRRQSGLMVLWRDDQRPEPRRANRTSATIAAMEHSERSALIAAVERCLAAGNGNGGGNRGVSVGTILAEAGLSTRAFYRHFGSKDALLLDLFRRESERMLAELRALAGAAAGPPEALRRWIDEYARLTGRRLVLSSREVARSTGYAAERARWTAAHRAAVADILRSGLDDGSLPWAEPEADARLIVAALSEGADGAEVAHFVFRALGARIRPGAGRRLEA
jgi:AcrR family transcriptional regulator